MCLGTLNPARIIFISEDSRFMFLWTGCVWNSRHGSQKGFSQALAGSLQRDFHWVGVPRTDRAHYFKGKLRNESISPLLEDLAKSKILPSRVPALLICLQDAWQVYEAEESSCSIIMLAVLVLGVQGLCCTYMPLYRPCKAELRELDDAGGRAACFAPWTTNWMYYHNHTPQLCPVRALNMTLF